MLSSRITNATQRYPFQTALVACVISIILHFWIKSYWHSSPAEALVGKPPQIIEVALITPPPPVVPTKVIQPKPEPPVPKKPKKVKEKPVPKPAPVIKAAPATPVKTQPKIIQKTFVQPTLNIKENLDAKTTAPVIFTPPSPVPPVKTTAIQNPAATTPKTHSNATKSGNGGQGSSSGVVALERILPKYPSRAASRHIEGHVTVALTITPDGEVSDAKVISATPEDIFDDAAIAAIEQWKFKPKIVNGVAVEQRAVQTLQFKLPK